VQRVLGLACVALLACAAALAVTAATRPAARARSGPQPVGSYVALVGSAGPEAFGRRTVCGGTLGAETLGVAQPTLPCGTRIYVTFHGKRVLTQVVDRGPYGPGRQFDVTDALARELGLAGVQTVTWSYVQPGS
jgi:rare lipoprotein A